MLTALIILTILVIVLVLQLLLIWRNSRRRRRSSFPPPKKIAVLLVTYDLRTPGHNYNPFYEALKQEGSWWHYISSTWLIATRKTPHELYSALVGHITAGDSLLVVTVKYPYWGTLTKEAWKWMDNWLKPK